MYVENEICISTSHGKKQKNWESKNIIQLSTSHGGKKKKKRETEEQKHNSTSKTSILKLEKSSLVTSYTRY